MIKPYLPPQFAKLADISDDSKNFLFGDSIANAVVSAKRKSNKILVKRYDQPKKKTPSKSTGTVKLPNLFEVLEEEFRPRTKIKKVCQILQQTTTTRNNPEQTTPVSSQVNTPTYEHTSILQEGQQAPRKEISISFEQALKVRDVDQIKVHLKISVDKFQEGCIKLYLHKWKELTSDMELISTVSGMPINIASNLPIINKYLYPFNDTWDIYVYFDTVLKKTKPGNHHHPLVFNTYPQNVNLCINDFLQECRARIDLVRENLDGNPQELILSYAYPFKPINSQSIARYIKFFLAMTGIEKTVFISNSVRSASTSKVNNIGLSIKDIKKAAGWKCSTTFRKYYKHYKYIKLHLH